MRKTLIITNTDQGFRKTCQRLGLQLHEARHARSRMHIFGIQPDMRVVLVEPYDQYADTFVQAVKYHAEVVGAEVEVLGAE